MTEHGVNSVLVCGNGLAQEMILAALSEQLPNNIKISGLKLTDRPNKDSFYGSITAPTAYNFFVSIGLNEQDLIQKTQTHFTFGTAFEQWAGKHNWVQCYEQPFEVWDNVLFYHYALQSNAPLAPFLIGSVAGLNGRFAHPPEEKSNPLSRAEYGYVFDAAEISSILEERLSPVVERKSGEIKRVEVKNHLVKCIELSSGEKIEADLIIDCDNPGGPVARSLNAVFESERSLETASRRSELTAGFSLKHIRANPAGWEASVRLQQERIHLTVGVKGMIRNPEFDIDIGKRNKSWIGNVVAIGHAAGVVEPLTPAPMMMLQRDIERLLDLFPVTKNMEVEAKEFNRLFENDYDHCNLFTRSLFEIDLPPNSPYWDEVRSTPCPEKLTRKLVQFNSRGHNTMYDLEPFNAEDWIIQHFGLGRKPARTDIFLDKVSQTISRNKLLELKTNIETMVQKMPPSDRYMQNYKAFLEKNNGA